MIGLDDWAVAAAAAVKQPLGVFVRNADFERADWLIEQARARLLAREEPASVAARMWLALLRAPVLSGPEDAQAVAGGTADWILRATGEAISSADRPGLEDLATRVLAEEAELEELISAIRRSTSRVEVEVQPARRTHIYVGHPIRGRQPAELDSLAEWREIVESAVEQVGAEIGIELRCTWPAGETPMEADQVWAAATAALWGRSGLALFLDDGGGSTGVGIEMILCGFVRHIVHLRPEGSSVSRQAEGMSKEANLTFVEFKRLDGLREQVVKALLSRESLIRAHNNAPGNYLLWARPALELQHRWAALDDEDKNEACKMSGIKRDRVERVFDPEALSQSSLAELSRIALSLGTTLHEIVSPQEHLQLDQKDEDKLRMYVREAGLDGETTLRLRSAGERYLALSLGRARPPWPMLHEQLRDGS